MLVAIIRSVQKSKLGKWPACERAMQTGGGVSS